MKKIVILITAVFCLLSALPVYAEFEQPPITDLVGYLTEEQNEELTVQLNSIREKYSFDVAFVSEKSLSAVDAQAAADDIYDYNGYGYGENYDGILFYIADSEREYHFSVCGSGETIFNENGLAYLEKKIVPYLKKDNYYAAVKSYADHTEELLEMAAEGKPFNKRHEVYPVCGCRGTSSSPYSCVFYDAQKALRNENGGQRGLCRQLYEAEQYES